MSKIIDLNKSLRELTVSAIRQKEEAAKRAAEEQRKAAIARITSGILSRAQEAAKEGKYSLLVANVSPTDLNARGNIVRGETKQLAELLRGMGFKTRVSKTEVRAAPTLPYQPLFTLSVYWGNEE